MKKNFEKLTRKKYLISKKFLEISTNCLKLFCIKRSFLSFKDVFRPKIRGQHGAGITYIEPKIVKNYPKYGSTDTEIFKNISREIFS